MASLIVIYRIKDRSHRVETKSIIFLVEMVLIAFIWLG